MKEQNFT